MKHHPFAAATLAICVTTLLGACASSVYRTPGSESREVSSLAVLEYNGSMSSGINIVEVDGQRRGFGFFRRYELAPGQRTLKVLLNVATASSEPIVLTFDAVASQTYELKYEILRRTHGSGGSWKAWIEDKQTGKLMTAKQD